MGRINSTGSSCKILATVREYKGQGRYILVLFSPIYLLEALQPSLHILTVVKVRPVLHGHRNDSQWCHPISYRTKALFPYGSIASWVDNTELTKWYINYICQHDILLYQHTLTQYCYTASPVDLAFVVYLDVNLNLATHRPKSTILWGEQSKQNLVTSVMWPAHDLSTDLLCRCHSD